MSFSWKSVDEEFFTKVDDIVPSVTGLRVIWHNLAPVITYRYRLVHAGITQIIPEIRIKPYPDSVKTLENR
jgi:hypothetical protein